MATQKNYMATEEKRWAFFQEQEGFRREEWGERSEERGVRREEWGEGSERSEEWACGWLAANKKEGVGCTGFRSPLAHCALC